MKVSLLITIFIGIGLMLVGHANIMFMDSGQNLGNASSWGISLVDLDGDHDLDAYFDNAIWLNDGRGFFQRSPRSNGSASQTESYRREIDFLKSFGPIDFAILPVGYHHLGSIDYEQYLYLIDQLEPKAIYLIGDDLIYEEHHECLKVLKKRNVPVEYPDGGIALGQRFHYIHGQIQK